MIIPDDLRVTTSILLKGALVFAMIDSVYVTILIKLVKPKDFVKMKWNLVFVMAIFFCVLFYSIMSLLFWDSVYSYVFPSWARWIIPPLYGLAFALFGLLFWWISLHKPNISVLLFCLFGGLWGIVTHVLAIQRGILEKPPMLIGSNPVAALTIAAFEFIFYWCVCLSISRLTLILKSKKTTNHNTAE
jgi:hypothetical protein